MVNNGLARFRLALESVTAQWFGDVVRVSLHSGTFGLDEIQRYGAKAPAIVLTINGDESCRRGGVLQIELMIAAFIITTDRNDAKRDASLLPIYERLLWLVHTTYWGFDNDPVVGVKTATKVKSRNMYDSGLDENRLALWGVQWEQLVTVTGVENYDSLDDFRRLVLDYDNMAPVDGQIVELPQ